MMQSQRRSVSSPLSAFDYAADDESFIEVTEWTNGEGWDVNIDKRHYSLSVGELAGINYMTAHLEYGGKTDFNHDEER